MRDRVQDLNVVGVEDGTLILASDDGTKFGVAVDEKLRAALRPSGSTNGAARKLALRDIQAHIRAGMSAEDVASVTGAPLEYIQKFEGAILAEREYVIKAALKVPVHTALETDPLGEGSTFGSVILERLHDLGASSERWASWKEQGGGWVVKLSFTVDEIDHDARWQFDPKKSALAPINNEANTLSQQGQMSGALIPRLRAVGGDDRVPDTSRFDSGAFTAEDLAQSDAAPPTEAVPLSRAGQSSVSPSAINRDPGSAPESGNTADLLDALRRRRGEREAAIFDDEESTIVSRPSGNNIRVVDVPLADFERGPYASETARSEPDATSATDAATPTGQSSAPVRSLPAQLRPQADEARSSQSAPETQTAPKARKGRATMPSWDDIVFGAKSDDD